MDIKFYGTAASEGVPAVFCDCENCRKMRELGGKNLRTRTSTGINDDLLIDFSMDSFAHVLYGGLNLSKIHHLLITHSHIDHFFPNDMFATEPPKAVLPSNWHLTVYGNKKVHQLWVEQAAREPLHVDESRISFQELHLFEKLIIEDYEVVPLQADHAHGEDCFLYLITQNGKNILYGHDTSLFPASTWQYLKSKKLDVVILDCTSLFSEFKFDPHMRFKDNLMIKQRMMDEGIADVKTVFVATHFVHTYILPHEQIESRMANYGFIPAYDGMCIHC